MFLILVNVGSIAVQARLQVPPAYLASTEADHIKVICGGSAFLCGRVQFLSTAVDVCFQTETSAEPVTSTVGKPPLARAAV